MRQLPHHVPGHTVSPVIKRLANALLLSFQLDHVTTRALRRSQGVSSLEVAIEQWLEKLLVIPDEQLGKLLLPTIISRFEEHLDRLRRVS